MPLFSLPLHIVILLTDAIHNTSREVAVKHQIMEPSGITVELDKLAEDRYVFTLKPENAEIIYTVTADVVMDMKRGGWSALINLHDPSDPKDAYYKGTKGDRTVDTETLEEKLHNSLN